MVDQSSMASAHPSRDEVASSPTASLKRRRSGDLSPPTTQRSRPKFEGDLATNIVPDSHAGEQGDPDHDGVDDDSLCPVCRLLLYQPVTTKCNHTLCESCMAHWADVSVISQMTIVSLDAETEDIAPSEIEAKCPMCRTQTSASPNHELANQLEVQYPRLYEQRRKEEDESESDASGNSVQTLTLYVGNKHEFAQSSEITENLHDWTFFVRPSRTDIVEEVQMLLHPTFRPSRIIRQRPPYEIRRRGWGYFTIVAYVILKAGYSWISDDAENAPDGASKGALPLEWGLDFSGYDGRGSMGRCRLKVKSDRGWDDLDDEVEEDQQIWQRTVAEYARDGRWEPEED